MHKISEKRRERGWTQSELATRSGVSQTTISQIESGNRKNPSINKIKKIAEAFEMSIEDLIDEYPQHMPTDIDNIVLNRRGLMTRVQQINIPFNKQMLEEVLIKQENPLKSFYDILRMIEEIEEIEKVDKTG